MVDISKKHRPDDPERQDAWHKARLDLHGFIIQNKRSLNRRIISTAKELYGPDSEQDHPYPSWSLKRGWYVELIYNFIEDCKNEMAKRPKKVTDEQITQMIELYSEYESQQNTKTWNYRRVGAKVGVSWQTVQKYVSEAQRQAA